MFSDMVPNVHRYSLEKNRLENFMTGEFMSSHRLQGPAEEGQLGVGRFKIRPN